MSLKEQIESIFDVFSRRESTRERRHKPNQLSGEVRGRVLILYLNLAPSQFRYQHIVPDFWVQIHSKLQLLYGRTNLSGVQTSNATEDLINFLNNCNADEFFDFIELSFKLELTLEVMDDENQVVDALNTIFRDSNAPYQLTPIVKVEEKAGVSRFNRPVTTIRTVAYPRIIRAEEELTYQEAVKPALSVLGAPHFEAANQEFRDAMDKYRKGDYEDSLAMCGSAFESVLKVLCKRKRWKYNEQDTSSQLLDVVFSKSTLEPFFKQPLMLIATMRNKLSSSHGGGSKVRNVEGHVAQYALTSTAAAIMLLVDEINV